MRERGAGEGGERERAQAWGTKKGRDKCKKEIDIRRYGHSDDDEADSERGECWWEMGRADGAYVIKGKPTERRWDRE